MLATWYGLLLPLCYILNIARLCDALQLYRIDYDLRHLYTWSDHDSYLTTAATMLLTRLYIS